MRMEEFRNILPPVLRFCCGWPNVHDTLAGGLLMTWQWKTAWLPTGVRTGTSGFLKAGCPAWQITTISLTAGMYNSYNSYIPVYNMYRSIAAIALLSSTIINLAQWVSLYHSERGRCLFRSELRTDTRLHRCIQLRRNCKRSVQSLDRILHFFDCRSPEKGSYWRAIRPGEAARGRAHSRWDWEARVSEL